ncbi:diaminopimelate decarboxylase [bacterium]|nr:diaminopimelate decarboxylase [bacterium]
MQAFTMRGNQLYCENVPVKTIVQEHGTPLFIYSEKTFTDNFTALDRAFSAVPHLICYSVKTNSNISVLKLLASLGAGFDIVSAGELCRVVKAGGSASRVVFAGVGKTAAEIDYALNQDIYTFTVESESELERISQRALKKGVSARIAIRVNPDVDPQTHTYISTGKKENKFGLDITRAKQAYRLAMKLPGISPIGVQMHIGSQILTGTPYAEALEKMVPLIRELQNNGVPLEYFDIGGGLGIIYDNESPQTPEQFASVVIPHVKNLGLTVLMEPGRFIAGNAGILVTKLEYVKKSGDKTFYIVDAAMNDLIRPSLYNAYHKIVPVEQKNGTKHITVDVVGPICESGDFFAKDRTLQASQENDLLAILSAGAYGFTMSSNYNTRPRPAEIMVTDTTFRIVRERETIDDLLSRELTCCAEYAR